VTFNSVSDRTRPSLSSRTWTLEEAVTDACFCLGLLRPSGSVSHVETAANRARVTVTAVGEHTTQPVFPPARQPTAARVHNPTTLTTALLVS